MIGGGGGGGGGDPVMDMIRVIIVNKKNLNIKQLGSSRNISNIEVHAIFIDPVMDMILFSIIVS